MKTKVTVYLKHLPSAVVFLSEDSMGNLQSSFQRHMRSGVKSFVIGACKGYRVFRSDDIAAVSIEPER